MVLYTRAWRTRRTFSEDERKQRSFLVGCRLPNKTLIELGFQRLDGQGVGNASPTTCPAPAAAPAGTISPAPPLGGGLVARLHKGGGQELGQGVAYDYYMLNTSI